MSSLEPCYTRRRTVRESRDERSGAEDARMDGLDRILIAGDLLASFVSSLRHLGRSQRGQEAFLWCHEQLTSQAKA